MINQTETIRLLNLEITNGARQLALTEAIMGEIGRGDAPPTVRLYSWSEPVVILGVGQTVADLDLEACQRLGHRVLRRIGGGTAVYHDEDEVSVDLIVPAGHRLAPGDVHAGYRGFAAMLAGAMGSIGVDVTTASVEMARSAVNDPAMRPICFASISPYEFLAGGRKLNGLCQIRRREVIAYQSAIYRRFKVEPLLASLRHDTAETRTLREQNLSDFVTDMEQSSDRSIDFRSLQDAIAEAISDTFGVEVEQGVLTASETRETERLMAEKYANDEWTFRR